MRADIYAALDPVLFGDYRASYDIRRRTRIRLCRRSRRTRHAIAVHSGTTGPLPSLCAPAISSPATRSSPSPTPTFSTTGVISQCGAIPVLCDGARRRLHHQSRSRPKRSSPPGPAPSCPSICTAMPANVKALRPIAERHGLKIVEDAAPRHRRSRPRPTGWALRRCDDVQLRALQAARAALATAPWSSPMDDDIQANLRLLTGYGYNPCREKFRPSYQDYIAEGLQRPA